MTLVASLCGHKELSGLRLQWECSHDNPTPLARKNHCTRENWLAACISTALPKDVRQSTLLQAWELLSVFYLNTTIPQSPITSSVVSLQMTFMSMVFVAFEKDFEV